MSIVFPTLEAVRAIAKRYAPKGACSSSSSSEVLRVVWEVLVSEYPALETYLRSEMERSEDVEDLIKWIRIRTKPIELTFTASRLEDMELLRTAVEMGVIKEFHPLPVLHEPLVNRWHEGVAFLLEEGADPNSFTYSRCHSSLLFDAVDNEDLIMLEMLLAAGADPNILEVPMPLDLARLKGLTDMVELLQRYGAVDLTDSQREEQNALCWWLQKE